VIAWRFDWTWAGASGSATDIDPRWVQRAALYSDDAGIRTVTLEVVLGVDVPALVAAGHHPYSGSGVLYAGDRVVIAGLWRAVSYESADDPVQIQITESESRDGAIIPRAGSVIRYVDTELTLLEIAEYIRKYPSYFWIPKLVDGTTFIAPQRRAKGAVYPMVFGAPGSSTIPGSRGLLTGNSGVPKRLMIAGHRVAASTVTIWGPEFGDTTDTKQANGLVSQANRPVLHDTDDGGNEYAYVEFDSLYVINTTQVGPYPDAEFFVSWTDGEALPGAAGDALLMLYAASTLRIDLAAWQSMRPILNRWRLDGYIDELVSPSELARRAILPILPIQVIATDEGLAPVVWPWLDLGASVPVYSLEEGPGFTRASRVSYTDDDPVAEVVLRYQPDAESGDYTAVAAASAGATPYGQVSGSLFGALAAGSTLEASWVWDQGTAQSLAAARLVARCVPRRRVRYAADPAVYGIGGGMELRPGQVVAITDAGLSMSGELAVIAEVEQTPVEMSVVLELRDDPIRD
jgi:hypothetical protein